MNERDFAAYHRTRLIEARAMTMPTAAQHAIDEALTFLDRRLTVRAHVGCHHCEDNHDKGLPCAWCGLTTVEQ